MEDSGVLFRAETQRTQSAEKGGRRVAGCIAPFAVNAVECVVNLWKSDIFGKNCMDFILTDHYTVIQIVIL